MCINEAYSRVRVGKRLYGEINVKNGSKQGDALSPLLFNFDLDHVVMRIQGTQGRLKLNSTIH
jgi:hypothetical protein